MKFIPFVCLTVLAIALVENDSWRLDLFDNNAYSLSDPILNYALLIGVNEYRDQMLPDLQNPSKDVAQVASELEQRFGFVVDTLIDPTRERITRKFDSIRYGYENQEYDPDGQLILFLSGHGDYDSFSKTGYFLPSDCRKGDLDATSFIYDKWRRYINSINCNHILVMIDACFSGTFDEEISMRSGDDRTFGRPDEPDNREILFQEHRKRKTRLFLSSGAKEKTPDKSEFTTNFLKALRSRTKTNGILTIESAYANFIKEARPVPILKPFGSNDPGSYFLFVEGGGGEQRVDLMERLLWNWVSQQQDSQAYAFFLDKYPDGSYKEDAETIYEKLTLSPASSDPQSEKILFVRNGGSGDGSSWESALGDLQMALEFVEPGGQIWVSAGVYYPTSSNDRSVYFEIPSDVKLYGGFKGVESKVIERNLKVNLTVLSGEIGTEAVDDNSNTVVYTKNVSSNTIVDGFVITGGNCLGMNRDEPLALSGAGWYNEASGGDSAPLIVNCTFMNNRAREGAGLYNFANDGKCEPQIKNSTFIRNIADLDGGAVFNNENNGVCRPVFVSTLFEANEATYGAGVFNKADFGITISHLIKCAFVGNVSYVRGSGVYNDRTGSSKGTCDAVMTGCRFENNISAEDDGK